MDTTPPTANEQVVTTIYAIYQWADTPTTIALVFGLAGAVFLGIYMLRRIRGKSSVQKI
jgi:hypothetical protein